MKNKQKYKKIGIKNLKFRFNNIRENFRNFVSSRGLRFTKERMFVLDEILRIDKHFEPDELYMVIRNNGVSVSRGTVYRTLSLLKEAGFIRKVLMVERQSHYELVTAKDDHYHFICRKCGKIIEFSSSEIRKDIKKEIDKAGFVPEHLGLEIYGICRECKLPG
ncbi:MAG: transcriptional repressor [Actinomycetia bacterium]|nr:transcriptional repressor [Actinomycetes bacterium]